MGVQFRYAGRWLCLARRGEDARSSAGPDDRLNAGGDMFEFPPGQIRVYRQGYETLIELDGFGTGFRSGLRQMRISRMQGDRYEVHAGADAPFFQSLYELASGDLKLVELQPDWIKVPRMPRHFLVRRQLDFFDGAEPFGVE